jgi:phosphohistidine phosphatase
VDAILIRHAKAGTRDPNSWPDDGKRPLSPQGREEQRAAARLMKRMGVQFNFLVTSPLVRARQTADIIAEAYQWSEPPQEAEVLGHGCTAQGVVKLLSKFPPDATVALVGHEPELSQVAAALIGRSGDAQISLKKSGVIGIRFEGSPAVGAGMLTFLLKPGHLRKLAR